MKKIITLIFLIFLAKNVNSQIGSKKSKIIDDHKNYTLETTDDGTEYISFEVEYKNYTQSVACYLTEKKENKEQICYRVLMIEPKSETNNWIKWFNDKNFIKLNGLVWKDYGNATVYEIEVKEGSCLMTKYFDEKL